VTINAEPPVILGVWLNEIQKPVTAWHLVKVAFWLSCQCGAGEGERLSALDSALDSRRRGGALARRLRPVKVMSATSERGHD
jgi:hypothetical protein